MGTSGTGEQFCDLCHRTKKHFEKEVSMYRCGSCPTTGRPLLCIGCVTVHYRRVHPSLYAELLLPKIKEQNEAKADN